MQRQIMKKMQQMQQKMQTSFADVQKELEVATVEGVAGGGAVKVVMTGNQEMQSIKIDPKAVDPEDVEMLEDLVLVAVRDALDKSRSLSADKMGRLAAGLNLPPGLL